MVGRPRREPTNGRGDARSRIDADDAVELSRAGTTTEQIDSTAKANSGGVVDGHRKPTVKNVGTLRARGENGVPRYISRAQPTQ